MAEPEEEREERIGLHNLSPAPRSRKARKRVGRGEGSGTGKTSGRGQKGWGSRSGAKRRAYDGQGQGTPERHDMSPERAREFAGEPVDADITTYARRPFFILWEQGFEAHRQLAELTGTANP